MSIGSTVGIVAMALMFSLSACSTQEEVARKPAPKPTPATPEVKPPAEKAAEKAPEKATKLAGDVGLLDTEKNYMILVSKEGKLVTIEFDSKFQPIQRTPHPAKIADVGLGSSAIVQYTKQGDKNVATSIEYLPAKGE